MPLPFILAAAVGAAIAAVAIATSDDDQTGDEEVSRNRQDAQRRAQREEAERQMRARRDSIRSDVEEELRRIAKRHKSAGRKVASHITFEMLEKAVRGRGVVGVMVGPMGGAMRGLTAHELTAQEFHAALDLLMPKSPPSRSRDTKDREIGALSEEIRILGDLSSAVSELAGTAEAKTFPSRARRIRCLERKLSALGEREEDSPWGEVSQGVEAFVRQAQAAVEPDSPVRIVACGLLCAGKSSLLNALTDQLSPEFFATGGGRTTRDCKALVVRLADDACRFADTPGIDAEAADDATATREVSVADHLLFVHTLAAGELHSAEVDFLETVVPNVAHGDSMPGLTMVLTHQESHEDVAERLTTSVLAKVEEVTGHRVPCFRTSATVYEKGMAEDKELLRELSGIEALRGHCAEIVRDKEQATAGRIARVARHAEQLRQDVRRCAADRKHRRECLVQDRKLREAELKKDFRRFLEDVAKRMETL